MKSHSVQQDMETVVGLEVHLQFNTKTKIFCGCANVFGAAPNSLTCPVCLGLPGSLPVLNEKAIEHAIKVALALNCEINRFIKFDRKNYYYPDLPKGYQISQFNFPIAHNGSVIIPTEAGPKKIRIKRAHLEEDAGKLIHDGNLNCSLVDYNRTGTPLLEIVTEPDIRSPQEAYDYLSTLKLILQYCQVSDCDMEKGSLRCDANVSVREKGETQLGTKTELKNMNSFKAVKTALGFESRRHAQVLQAGERIIQETRLWDDQKETTVAMRSKEEAHDYRYFPEPDLVPFNLSESLIEEVRRGLPEFPAEKLNRLLKQYQITEYDGRILIQDPDIASFFESCTGSFKDTKKICNWIIGPLMSELNSRKKTILEIKIKPEFLTELITAVEEGTVSNLVGKDILTKVIDSRRSPKDIINQDGLAQVNDDSTLEQAVDEVIAENAKIISQIKEGKDSALGFLVGQTMRKTQGKANPKRVSEIIKRRLFS